MRTPFECEDCGERKPVEQLRYHYPADFADGDDPRCICLTCSTKRPPGTTHRPVVEGGR